MFRTDILRGSLYTEFYIPSHNFFLHPSYILDLYFYLFIHLYSYEYICLHMFMFLYLYFLCLYTFMFISPRNSDFMKPLNTYAVAIRWQLPVTARNLKELSLLFNFLFLQFVLIESGRFIKATFIACYVRTAEFSCRSLRVAPCVVTFGIHTKHVQFIYSPFQINLTVFSYWQNDPCQSFILLANNQTEK